MNQRKAEAPKTKTGRKKLPLGKETLKDLRANVGRATGVRGGARQAGALPPRGARARQP